MHACGQSSDGIAVVTKRPKKQLATMECKKPGSEEKDKVKAEPKVKPEPKLKPEPGVKPEPESKRPKHGANK